MNITVVWAAPGIQDSVPVKLAPGATAADAVARSGVIEHYALDATHLKFAVFGRRVVASTLLAEGDRVEITRPLVADPQDSRRRRALGKSPSQHATQSRRNPRR